MEKGFRALPLWVAAAALVATGGGCGYAYKEAIGRVSTPYYGGQFAIAEHEAAIAVQQSPERDRLAMLLEQGACLRAAGQWRKASRCSMRRIS